MEKMHLTYEQAMNEPIEVINRAFIIWKLDAQHEVMAQSSSD
ncbi:hypothetical protein QN355_11775 [Cryobacterium sp. 10S3]|nr:hypothetical protein [Cryobacterium sp. 10S3]MEB0287233.1 hypothetical protein [Cryobacterium sp. 10S3]